MSLEHYPEHILDHSKNPRNRGTLDPADIVQREDNPLCGDKLELTLRLDAQGRVADVKFSGEGCAISMASMSLVSEELRGKSVDELLAFPKDKVLDLIGVPLTPPRLRCAFLSYHAVQNGTKAFRSKPRGK